MQLTCKVQELIDAVTTNREAHIIQYKAAKAQYEKDMEEYGRQMEVYGKSHGKVDHPQEPRRPYNQVATFDRMLKRLKSHQVCRDEITLDSVEYDIMVFGQTSGAIPKHARGMFLAQSVVPDFIDNNPADHVEIE